MQNIDIIIYAKNLIQELDNDGFFIPNINPMMEKDIFENHLFVFCEENMKQLGEPTVDEEQLEEVINRTTHDVILATINSLYDKGLIDIVGMDESGDCIYAPTDKAVEAIKSNKDIK
jgi:hypothetical protein